MEDNTKKTASNPTEEKREKRVNPTWEAMLKYQGAFTYVAPEFRI